MANAGSGTLGDDPPVYRIDLSLPPSQRYVRLAEIYRKQLRSLTGLFDALVLAMDPRLSVTWIKRVARLFLRKLYSDEETEEIKGISRVTGIELYLLVALNVLLDPLMGCTSGAARSQQGSRNTAKMLHFRTLDWGMDGLRKLIVQLEFVRGPETDKVLATSITYVGFVGVLTAVRKDLSVSLNFRPNHDMSSFSANYRFYASHLLVILGVRQSISSLLRQYIFPQEPKEGLFRRLFKRYSQKEGSGHGTSLETISSTLPSVPTTAAYLVFCDGTESLVLEKDHRSAVTSSSSSFIVATNSDMETSSPSYQMPEADHGGAGVVAEGAITMADLIVDSNDRRDIMEAYWEKKVNAKRWSQAQGSSYTTCRQNPLRKTRTKNINDVEADGLHSRPGSWGHGSPANTSADDVAVRLSELIRWITTYPITNEMTHFTTVMDPSEGKVAWIRRFPRPLEFEDE